MPEDSIVEYIDDIDEEEDTALYSHLTYWKIAPLEVLEDLE